MIVNIPSLKKKFRKKKFFIVLSKIFGIGFSTARILCLKQGLNPNLQAEEVSLKKAQDFSKIINENLRVDIDLGAYLKKKKDIHLNSNTYKGVRHKMHLPVNGQRTRSNASIGKPFRVVKDPTKKTRREMVVKKRPQFFPKL